MNLMIQQSSPAHQHYSHPIGPDARVLQRSDALFNMGDQLKGVYRVKSGAIKLIKLSRAGDQQIIGFYMPGELIGLDALADGMSHSTAIALETSSVTLIPFQSIFSGNEEFDYEAFIHHIGACFNHENDHSMMLSQATAGRRLAWFLTEFSDGLVKRGLRARVFTLPMIRADIGLFLGLAVETVSRELSRMSKQGLLKKNQREFELLDINRLRQLASGDDSSSESFTWSNQASQPATVMAH